MEKAFICIPVTSNHLFFSETKHKKKTDVVVFKEKLCNSV